MIRTIYVTTNMGGGASISHESLNEALRFVKVLGKERKIFVFKFDSDIPQYKAAPTGKGEVSVYQLIPNPE